MSLPNRFFAINASASRRVPNWLRLLFPILLGAILIAMFVQVMFFGSKREHLVSQGESSIIRWSLAFAQRLSGAPSTTPDTKAQVVKSQKSASKIVTISVHDSDLDALELAPNSQIRDAHIREYARVLEQVAASNPEWVVISWLTYAHPMTEEYLKPLTSVINRLNFRDKVTLAVNLFAAGTIATEFIHTYNIVEARDCGFNINLICAVAPEWSWMPQQVMNRFLKEPKPWRVSLNLPNVLPSVLLNLPPTSSIVTHSFLDFRPPVMSSIPSGSIIFIGNDALQSLHFRDNKEALQRTYTAASGSHRTLMKDGIPWHVFWAEMASMFTSDETIAVVPAWLCLALIAGMTLFMIAAIARWGGATLAPFLAIAVGFSVINLVLVSTFKIYLPVILLLVTGLIVFIAAAFVSVAYSSYSKWRFQAEAHLAESTSDIKQNFIHLISHNLNTPIAQLRGLLEILSSKSPADLPISKAATSLEFIRLTVRAVLNSTTMAAQELVWEDHSIRGFIHEFLDNENVFFRQTGVEMVVLPKEDDEDTGEIWFFKCSFDRAMVNACLVYASALLSLRRNSRQITLHFSPVNSEPADPQGLIVTLTSTATKTGAPLLESDFATGALSGFIDMAVSRGVVQKSEGPASITLTFAPRSTRTDG
jgi:signal transduction histidine kinase